MPTSSTKPTSKVGRNDRCECNSGKKVKACCGMKKAEKSAVPKPSTAAHQELLHPSRDTMQDYTNSLRDKASKLAEKIFDEPGVEVSIVSETTLPVNKWKSYVMLKRAELTPLESQNCTKMHPTCEESLQAFVVDLETRLEAKELEAYRLATEKRYQAGDADETDETGGI